MRTRIKICGLTREQDVHAAVEAGADAIGFVLYEGSPRCVSIARAAALARLLPPLVQPVLLCVNEPAERVRAACAAVPGALLQFHGDETPEACEQLAAACARPYWRAVHMRSSNADSPAGIAAAHDALLHCAALYSSAQALLLDAPSPGYGGSGKTFNWSLLPPNAAFHLVLSGGLTPANVADGIAALRARAPRSLAVDVSSGVEASGADGQPLRGIKDAEKIRCFIAAVRAADGNT